MLLFYNLVHCNRLVKSINLVKFNCGNVVVELTSCCMKDHPLHIDKIRMIEDDIIVMIVCENIDS